LESKVVMLFVLVEIFIIVQQKLDELDLVVLFGIQRSLEGCEVEDAAELGVPKQSV